MSGSQVHSNLVRQALESVLKDEGFKIGGSKANATTESPIARCVLHWVSMLENEKSIIVGGICLSRIMIFASGIETSKAFVFQSYFLLRTRNVLPLL